VRPTDALNALITVFRTLDGVFDPETLRPVLTAIKYGMMVLNGVAMEEYCKAVHLLLEGVISMPEHP
jgi:hypothetical protein